MGTMSGLPLITTPKGSLYLQKIPEFKTMALDKLIVLFKQDPCSLARQGSPM